MGAVLSGERRTNAFLILVGVTVMHAGAPAAAWAGDDRGRAAVFLRAEDSDGCGLRAAFEAALRRLVPGIAIGGQGPPSGDDLIVTLGAGSDLVAIRIDGADGGSRLSRRLRRRPGDSCRDLADAAAYVVERFVRALAWPGLSEPLALGRRVAVRPGPMAPIAVLPPPAVADTAAETEVATAEVAETAPAVRRRWHGAARLGVVVAGDRPLAPGLAAALRLRPGAPWFGELQALVYSADEVDVAITEPDGSRRQLGTSFGHRAELRLGLGRCLGRRTTGCISAAAAGQLSWVGARGADLFRESTTTAFHPAAALSLSLGRALPRGLRVELELAAAVALGRTEFVVEGLDRPVHRTPGWGLHLGLAVARNIF